MSYLPSWARSTYTNQTCTNDLAWASPSGPTAADGTFPRAKKEMSPHLKGTSRLQNSPMGYSLHHTSPAAFMQGNFSRIGLLVVSGKRHAENIFENTFKWNFPLSSHFHFVRTCRSRIHYYVHISDLGICI